MEYDSEQLYDIGIKFRLIKLINKYKDKMPINTEFDINSLDLSVMGDDAITRINEIFPEIKIDYFETICESVAEKLEITLTYTDEDYLEGLIDCPAYLSRIESKYIDEYLKKFNENQKGLNELFNFFKSDYESSVELFISKTKEYYILYNLEFNSEHFIDVIKTILEFHIYAKNKLERCGRN